MQPHDLGFRIQGKYEKLIKLGSFWDYNYLDQICF